MLNQNTLLLAPPLKLQHDPVLTSATLPLASSHHKMAFPDVQQPQQQEHQQQRLFDRRNSATSDGSSNSGFLTFGGPIRQLKRAHSRRDSILEGSHGNSSNKSKKRRIDGDEASSICMSTSSGSDLSTEMNKALLHHACRLYANELSIIECALELNAESIRQESKTECPRPKNLLFSTTNAESTMHDSRSLASVESGAVDKSTNSNNGDTDDIKRPASQSDDGSKCEFYKYPINVALKHNASLEVVQLLAMKAPDVLALPDGPDECGSLSIFLQHCQYSSSGTVESNAHIVHCLLRASRETAAVLDRHHNTPLHRAVRAARCLPHATLQRIHAAFPAAAQRRNFHGQLPIDLAVRAGGAVPVAIADWLQTVGYPQAEQAMTLADQELDRSLHALHEEDLLSNSSSSQSTSSRRNVWRTASPSTFAQNRRAH